MELVDTHCHLQFAKLKVRADGVIADAATAGVTRLICVGTTLANSAEAIAIASRHPKVWASVGTHPHDVKDFGPAQITKFKKLLDASKVVAIGEIGLDFYKLYCPKAQQLAMLRVQIEAGLPSSLPFIFHVREAFADFWPVFDSYPGLRGVIHSFSAGPAELEQIVSRGLIVGLNGIVTFSQDEDLAEAIRRLPAKQLVLETDAPFLTPQPVRGQLCEPKHIRPIAEFLAERRGETLQELAAYSTTNATRLFNLR